MDHIIHSEPSDDEDPFKTASNTEIASCLVFLFASTQRVSFLRLECDQECATQERNRRLAEALQIDSSSDPFNARSSSVYSDSLKDDARSGFLYLFTVRVV